MLVKEVSSASKRIHIMQPFKLKPCKDFLTQYFNRLEKPLVNSQQDRPENLVNGQQNKRNLELNTVFSEWARNTLELNPNLEFDIYRTDGSMAIRSKFYSKENLEKTLKLCEEACPKIEALVDDENLLGSKLGLMAAVSLNTLAAKNGCDGYFLPKDMPENGSPEYSLRLTEAKMAQFGWFSDIPTEIMNSDYSKKLKKSGYFHGDEKEHMEKCFLALPGAVKRLGAAASAREAKYDDVSSAFGITHALCESVIDVKIELDGHAGSKARELVFYLRSELYDSNKLFELFNSALCKGSLEKGKLEKLVLKRPEGRYYIDLQKLVSENTIFRKNNDKFKVRLLAYLAGHIFELSALTAEE